MSDQYEEYAQYQQYENAQVQAGYDNCGEMQQEVEQDYETKVELDYFEAEQLLRKNQLDKCLVSLQELYTISTDKQLKNWKVKILNFLLQIYCRSNHNQKIQQTLQRIADLNQKQKYTQNAIKSIIMTIKSLPSQNFNSNKDLVYGFIAQLDNLGKIRSYLLFLEKAVDQNDLLEAQKLFKVIRDILGETTDVPSSNLIELFSFEIRHSKKTKTDISKEVRKMQLKLSNLQAQSYMSQGHISIIKEAVAQTLYQEDNYLDCAVYLCEAFQQNMKYGKSTELKKNLLKTNLLVALLSDNQQFYTIDKFNALYHESASSFKGDNDIQCLYGMVQSFIDCDLNSFIQQSKVAQLNFGFPYENLQSEVITKLKTRKLLQIVKPYTKIKCGYLTKRLNCSKSQVQKMIFALISDDKIQGRIRRGLTQTFLDISPPKDDFLDIQLSNIKEISKRYI